MLKNGDWEWLAIYYSFTIYDWLALASLFFLKTVHVTNTYILLSSFSAPHLSILSISFVIHLSSGYASHFLECVWISFFFFQLICRYPFLTKWVLFPSFFILQPKGLTFPGSQHPPFFQLVLRRSKLLLTPVTAIVSFCFVSTSCFLLLCVCFFNTNHCLSHSMTYVSQQWFKRNVFVDKSSFMIY